MGHADFRDTLFGELHAQFLRPLGYSRRARRSERTTSDGLALLVALESSTWNTAEHVDLGIDLQARHPAYLGGLLMNIGLRRYVDPPKQRWTVDRENSADAVSNAVAQAFSRVAVPLLEQMSTFDGLATLCAGFGPVRFYESHCWCLLRVGKSQQAMQVLKDAVLHAPHEGVKNHALHLLQQHGA